MIIANVTGQGTNARVLTIPNLISLARLAAVPVFWWVLLGRDDVTLAAVLILVIGATDWVDGYLARRLDQVSRLGAALDPIADRLMIASAVIGGMVAGVVPLPVGSLLITREAVAAVMSLVLFFRRSLVLEVRYLGKVATFILYGAIPLFYLAAADIWRQVLLPLAWALGLVGLLLYWLVVFHYMADVRRLLTVESGSPREES